MSYVGAAVVGSAAIGYMASQNAANTAAGAMTSAADSANATQQYMYDTTRADQQPWRQAGAGALSQLSSGMSGVQGAYTNDTDLPVTLPDGSTVAPHSSAYGVTGANSGDLNRDFTMADFQADPGYQFRMSEGMKALNQSAAARGSLNSGGTLKALTRYGQGVASDEYQSAYNRFNSDRDRRFNRLASIAGLGQTANGQLAAAGTNYANNVSQNQMAVGNVNAAAAIQQGNNTNNLLSNGANTWMNYQMMNRAFPQQSAAPTAASPSSYGSQPGYLGNNTQFQTAY